MTLGHFSPILGHLKIAAKEAAETVYAHLKRILSALLAQVKAPSVNDSQEGATEYQVLKDLVEAYSGDRPPPLLVFGDSVFLRVATDDQSHQSLGGILGAYFQDGVFQVSGSGYHSGVFEQFSAVLATLSARPRIAIVPINLRSFSPTWDLNPLYQFHPEIELLSTFDMKRSDFMLHDTKPSSELEVRIDHFKFDGEKAITLDDFHDIIGENPEIGSEEWNVRLKSIFRHHYMYPVHSWHRKIKNLKQIIRLLNEGGVAVYCYITPINYEAGMEYCGDIFIKSVEKNISIIRQEIESVFPAVPANHNALMFRLDDFSFRFAKTVFFTSHNATEHLRYEGRDFIARRIISEAERVLFEAGTFK